MIEHDVVPKANHEIPHRNDRAFLHGPHIPIEAKKTAKRPSSTITRKIDFTTDAVVCSPNDSALPLTSKPSAQATTPITSPMNGALIIPTLKWVTEMASVSRAM